MTSCVFTVHFPVRERIMLVGNTFLFLLITLTMYAKIFNIARKQREQRFATFGSFVSPQQSIRKYKEHLRELKFASMFILIILCTLMILGFEDIEIKLRSEFSMSRNNFIIWPLTLGAMNSTFNCLVFFWKNKTLRKESKK